MKDLVKAINRLSKALEIQNNQLEQLRNKEGNDSSNMIWMTLMYSMLYNNPWNYDNKVKFHNNDIGTDSPYNK